MNGMVFSSTIGSTPWSDGLHDMSHFLTVQLEPIANQLNQLGIPEPIQHWGHPFFMSIVIFAMGSAVAITGWKGRLLLTSNETASIDNRSQHRKIAPWMFLFLSMGYSGGLLSLVMQHKPLLESPHFWTGTVVIALLALNGFISFTGFLGNKSIVRTIHAYLGSLTFGLLILHTFLGFNLGLSL